MKPRVKDWLKWVAAGFALVATASAEYDLARAIGMNEWIAMAVPGALDAYVVRALRAHREVLTAVLTMVGVNAASHLVTAGIMPVDWRLITAVSAIPPLVLWRVHALSTPGEARARVLWGLPLCASTEPDEHGHAEDAEEHDDERAYEHDPGDHARVLAPFLPGDVLPCVACSQPVTFTDGHGWEHNPGYDAPCVLKDAGTDEHDWNEHVSTAVGVSDYVPAAWSLESSCSACSHLEHGYGECQVCTPGHGCADALPVEHASTLPVREPGASLDGHVPEWQRPPLTVVPPLPAGYEHDEHGVLQAGDVPFKEQARVLDKMHRSTYGKPVPVRVLKMELSVGTPRAQRLSTFLADEHASTEEASTDADRD